MKEYPYASGDLLSNPNTYFYTPYEGIKFVESWKQSRADVTADIGEEAPPPVNRKSEPLPEVMKRINDGSAVKTETILDSLYVQMNVKKNDNGVDIFVPLNIFLKRFEVSKRIYKAYGKEFRVHDKDDYNDLTLYLYTAEVFESAYRLTGKMQYINALLKCVDILCAFNKEINKHCRRRVAWLIGRERHHIIALAESIGVSV